MEPQRNIQFQEENDLQKILQLITRNYYLFIIGVVSALAIAFLINRYAIPIYKVTSSLLIKENQQQQNMSDVLSTNLFGTNKNLQNELLLVQSSPVITQTIKNLDLPVSYYRKKGFQYYDAYKNVPFRVMYAHNHVQPLGARFEVTFGKGNSFMLKAEGEKVSFYNFEENSIQNRKEDWTFKLQGKLGQLIENPELSFIIELDSTKMSLLNEDRTYYFDFTSVPTLTEKLQSGVEFNIPDKKATAIEISMKTSSLDKGLDILNGITDVYSNLNLERKNHLAEITISYIDKQLGEISDSLNKTEQKLQNFRSSNQLLNVKEQSTGISDQYVELQNKRAELTTNKRYYESVLNSISKNEDFSNLIIPSSMGIQDPLNNTLMGELITAQSQKNLLIESNQEKNPLVKRLSIQIENLKRTISDNVANVLKTNDISLDELNKRIGKLQAEISKMPNTERLLTGIERKYRLNDAIYNFLMEKRANANITRASNLPDIEIIESAKMSGGGPVFPNKRMNYIIAFIIGLVIPFGYLQLKSSLNTKIVTQDQIERITNVPVLGKILHNSKKTNNVVFEYPSSNISESYRALRTNLEYYVRGGHKKVILVTSSIEGEGKSFNALNIAMSYAQLDRRTILIDFDLRKHTNYFNDKGENLVGMSSYLINKANLDDIIIHSPHSKLDYISSGPIPPNPVELIGLEKTEKLINHLKGIYDYIIIDTPPMAQVTDAFLLIEQADVKVIVARYNYTLKNVFSFIMKDLLQKNIGNVCIVLNDNRVYRDQYGYGYGYNKKA
jgi:capsular exopolysaccharide synthesis family protein